ncbi:hypothetical protein ACQRIT_002355 [Beauveria bassiana]
MHLSVSSLDFISTFVACGVSDVYIAVCFGIAIFTRKSIVFQTTRLTLAFATLLSCTIVFLKSPPEAHLRRYVCINSLRVSGAVCICIEPVIFSYDIRNDIKSYRAKTVFWVSLLSTTALLGVGGWQVVANSGQENQESVVPDPAARERVKREPMLEQDDGGTTPLDI